MFNTLNDIKRANERVGYFFNPSTMRFFNSRVSKKIYRNAYGAYFVTSERYDEDSARRYTVRYAEPSGSIWTVGEHQQYETSTQAHKAAAAYQDIFAKRPKR